MNNSLLAKNIADAAKPNPRIITTEYPAVSAFVTGFSGIHLSVNSSNSSSSSIVNADDFDSRGSFVFDASLLLLVAMPPRGGYCPRARRAGRSPRISSKNSVLVFALSTDDDDDDDDDDDVNASFLEEEKLRR